MVGLQIRIGAQEHSRTLEWQAPCVGHHTEGQVAIIDLAEGQEPGEYQKRQDRGFNLIISRLRMNRELLEGRRLRVHLQTLTFGPELAAGDETDPARWSRERVSCHCWNAARQLRSWA